LGVPEQQKRVKDFERERKREHYGSVVGSDKLEMRAISKKHVSQFDSKKHGSQSNALCWF
jgi:hypothetical protein